MTLPAWLFWLIFVGALNTGFVIGVWWFKRWWNEQAEIFRLAQQRQERATKRSSHRANIANGG